MRLWIPQCRAVDNQQSGIWLAFLRSFPQISSVDDSTDLVNIDGLSAHLMIAFDSRYPLNRNFLSFMTGIVQFPSVLAYLEVYMYLTAE